MRSSSLSVFGLALSLAGFNCRARSDEMQRGCPPPRAVDASISFGSRVTGTRAEAWAIGSVVQSNELLAHKLLRWDGCDWQVAPSPLDGGKINRLSAIWSNGRDVWLSGSQEGYSEGTEVFGRDGSISRLRDGGPYCAGAGWWFRRRGDGWEEVVHPNNGRNQFLIAGRQESDLWMLERSCRERSPGGTTLVHWNGNHLEPVAIDPALGEPRTLWAAASAGNVWVAAENGIGRWDGSAWRSFLFGKDDWVLELAGGGPSDLWAFGKNARHWNGRRWSEPLAPSSTPGTNQQGMFSSLGAAWTGGHTFASDRSGAIYRADLAKLSLIGRTRPWGEWLTSWQPQVVGPNELVLWPANAIERPALRWRRGGWDVSPTTKAAGPAGDDVVALWSDGAGVTWAALSVRVALDARLGEIRRHDGHAWAKVMDLQGFPIRFGGTAPDDIWLVGLEGWSWHFDGRSWKVVPIGVRDNLLAVWAAGRNDVWVGSSGGLLNWDGRTWRLSSRYGAANAVYAVKAMSGTGSANRVDHVVASWGADRSPSDVWLSGAGDGWLAGTEYLSEPGRGYGGRLTPSTILLHWDGKSWTRPDDAVTAVDGNVPLNAIAGSGPADVWVVGNQGAVLHWNGGHWDRLVPVTEEHLHAVTVELGGAVWVGGTRGFLQKLR